MVTLEQGNGTGQLFKQQVKPVLSLTQTLSCQECVQGTALLHGEAGGQIQIKGREAWLADSQFLTLLNAILCNLLFSNVFGPASSRGMKRLSQHAGFLLPTGGVCPQPERNPA